MRACVCARNCLSQADAYRTYFWPVKGPIPRVQFPVLPKLIQRLLKLLQNGSQRNTQHLNQVHPQVTTVSCAKRNTPAVNVQ